MTEPSRGWIDLVSRSIVRLGFPTIVAGWLLWVQFNDLRELRERMVKIESVLMELLDRLPFPVSGAK